MSEKLLQPFFRAYPSSSQARFPTDAAIQNFTGKLPEGLLNIWQVHGWGSYRDGLFWLVDPTDYRVILETWGIDPNRATVFLRSSFGDLFFWDSHIVYRIQIHYGNILDWDDSLDNFLKFRMRYEPYLSENFDLELHYNCLSKLGSLSSDEMFGFEPALILGGKKDVEFARRLNLFTHIDILTQLYL
ncbi:MAG: DUF1851 domain-containing protein [Richelia sp. RM1_1_1]|nr:DUF1851 domain-containing protein [Richelia sp. RM1_1_1]